MLQQNKGWGKNVIVMYTCKDNLTPLLYSGKKKKKKNSTAAAQVTLEASVQASVQWGKGPCVTAAVPLLLWLTFNSWSGNFHMPRVWPQKKKRKAESVAQSRPTESEIAF